MVVRLAKLINDKRCKCFDCVHQCHNLRVHYNHVIIRLLSVSLYPCILRIFAFCIPDSVLCIPVFYVWLHAYHFVPLFPCSPCVYSCPHFHCFLYTCVLYHILILYFLCSVPICIPSTSSHMNAHTHHYHYLSCTYMYIATNELMNF